MVWQKTQAVLSPTSEKFLASILGVAFFVTFLLLFSGCGGKSIQKGEEEKLDAEKVFQSLCSAEAPFVNLEGSVWIQTRSKGVSGQFPADITWKTAEPVTVSVTNPLGGREAIVELTDQEFQVKRVGKGGKLRTVQRGKGHWSGIPLRFASALFSGKVPCPMGKVSSVTWQENYLTAIDAEYRYQYAVIPKTTAASASRSIPSDFFVQKMIFSDLRELSKSSGSKGETRWGPSSQNPSPKKEGMTEPLVLEFKEPDSDFYGQAKKWTAQSQFGEVQMRWRSREGQLSASVGNHK